MKEQEIPARSGKVYQFIPAERNDTIRDTGCPKYLPVQTCGDDGVNCELIVNTQYSDEHRQKKKRCLLKSRSPTQSCKT